MIFGERKTESRWVEYDWLLNSVPAKYRVNLEVHSCAPNTAKQILLLIKCSTKDPQSGELTLRDRRFADSVENKCIKQLDALYAGSIESGPEIRMYFYTGCEQEFEKLFLIAEKENRLLCTCTMAFEPQLQTYYRLLYPDAAKYQTIQNKTLIENIAKRGDNSQAPRRINLHMHFPTEPLRILFQEEARLAGFAIGDAVYWSEQELAYGVVLHCISTLNKRAVDLVTTRAIRVAEEFQGELLQWDCQFICKGSPIK